MIEEELEKRAKEYANITMCNTCTDKKDCKHDCSYVMYGKLCYKKGADEYAEKLDKVYIEKANTEIMLDKAKELIKKLLHALKNEDSDYTFALESTHPVLVEVEQFLKEITQ